MKKLHIFSLFLLLACKEPAKVKIAIDNPKISHIEVKIDGQSYPVPAEGMIEVELLEGKHHFEAKWEDGGLTGDFQAEKEGLLNATGSEYVLWNELFLSKEVTPEEAEAIYISVLKEDTIKVEGSKYIGSFVKYEKDQYFIPKTWDFNAITPFPLKPQMNARYETKKKIFRKMPFIKEYEERYAFDDKEMKRLTDSVLDVINQQK